MTPYLEVRRLPHRSRRWIAIVVGAVLIVPVGALLPGGTDEPLLRVLAIVAVMLGAPVLGLAFSQPHETIEVDGDAGVLTRRRVGQLPDPRAQVTTWPISAVRAVTLEDIGTPVHPEWGVSIALDDGITLPLKSYPEWELAQDTVDHLALLGLPGASRARQREADFAATAPPHYI